MFAVFRTARDTARPLGSFLGDFARARPPARRADVEGADAQLARMIATGGGAVGREPHPVFGAARFGAASEAGLAPVGHAAALADLVRIASTDRRERLGLEDWFDRLRGDLARLLRVPEGDVVLAASPADAARLALAMARGPDAPASRPLTVVVAGHEASSDFALAARGRHALSEAALGGTHVRGAALDGWDDLECDLRAIPLHEGDAVARPQALVDADAAREVAIALERGRDVLLHVLDRSATGARGVSRQAAHALAAGAPGRVRLLVDAGQARHAPGSLGADLAAGAMVLVGGSTFAGGPAGCAALLVPAGTSASRPAPAGLSAFSASLDWPAARRASTAAFCRTYANPGLGLRWSATLAGMAAYEALPPEIVTRVRETFVAEVRRRMAFSRVVDEPTGEAPWAERTLVAMVVRGADGRPLPRARVAALAADLAAPMVVPPGGGAALGRPCDVGGPERLGEAFALTASLTMPMVVAIAAALAAGQPMERAARPLCEDLDRLFRKLGALTREVAAVA